MRYIKRVLDINHDLERKSQFLFGPRQTGKTSWIKEELEGVRYRFNLLDKKLVKSLQDDPALFAGILRREGIDSGLVVVDEIQKLPFLLDEVHNLIESTDIRLLIGFGKIEAGSTEYGKFFETYIAMEMRAYIGYRSRQKLNITPLCYWRSLSGFETDFILMEKIVIETKTTRRHTARDLKGLKALQEEGLFSRYILVCSEDYAQTTEDGIEIVPWRQFLDES